MALIKQVKVGGVIYDISMKVGDGILISDSGAVCVKFGSGLYIGVSGEICATGVITGVGSGLTIEKGPLELKIGSGLTLNSKGELDIRS